MIDVFLSNKPTPTIGAPPKVAPGVPKAPPPPLPVVPGAFVVAVPPGVVPPIPVDEP